MSAYIIVDIDVRDAESYDRYKAAAPSERAKQWLDSPEYREARAMRHRAARTNMVVIEGVP